MKFILLIIISLQLFASQKVEQTICFSKTDCNSPISYVKIGDAIKLCEGKCKGVTLKDMNQKGWKLTQIIHGVSTSYGMLFTRSLTK